MEEAKAITKNKFFMLVDDDKIMHFINSKLIKGQFIDPEVQEFLNGESALAFLHKNCEVVTEIPDVIILDIDMPVMNGWDFLEEYQKLEPLLPKKPLIYMLSSSNFTRDLLRSRTYSVVKGYFVKPLTLDCLQTIMNDLLDVTFFYR